MCVWPSPCCSSAAYYFSFIILFYFFGFFLLLLVSIFVVELKPVRHAMAVQQSCIAQQKKLFNTGAAGDWHSGWTGCLNAGFSDSASGFLRVQFLFVKFLFLNAFCCIFMFCLCFCIGKPFIITPKSSRLVAGHSSSYIGGYVNMYIYMSARIQVCMHVTVYCLPTSSRVKCKKRVFNSIPGPWNFTHDLYYYCRP